MHHYRNFTVFPTKTRSSRIIDIVEFLHHHITVPSIIPEDKVINAIAQLKNELSFLSTPNKDNQLEALANLRTLFSKHRKSVSPSHAVQDKKTRRNIRQSLTLTKNFQGSCATTKTALTHVQGQVLTS